MIFQHYHWKYAATTEISMFTTVMPVVMETYAT